MNRSKAVLLLLLSLALAVPAAWAQTTAASLRGVVRDESGPVASASIIAEGTQSGFTYTAETGSDGSFSLPGLQPGTYTITVAAPSHEPQSRDVQVLLGQNVELDFVLGPGQVFAENVTVVGESVQLLIDSKGSEISTNITPQQIETLPQTNRNFLALATLAPGPHSLPIVLLNCRVEGTAFDSINIDNYGGALAMIRHLASLGHRRIAHIKGAPSNNDALERLLGYRDAMQPFCEQGTEELEIQGDFSEESGYRAGGAILRMTPRPTAIFAANDGMAVGLLAALQEAGLRVPEDIAVAGFDDIPIARFLTPPLTTVRLAIAELGALAVQRLLLAMTRGEDRERQHEVLPTTLVIRGSCGASAFSSEPSEDHSPTDVDPRRRV